MLKNNRSILPSISSKRYFTISEVGDLCGVKSDVLRYWEQEFTQLRHVKHRGNRRYYQRNDVILIREIRILLYEQSLTIEGARNLLKVETKSKVKTQNINDKIQLIKDISAEIEDIKELLV